jgi:hypothetical protein
MRSWSDEGVSAKFVLVNETELVFSCSSPFLTPHHEHNDRDHRGQQHRDQC